MSQNNGLIWLASYPKSGNTWARLFLNRLSHNGQLPLDLNHIAYAQIASGRELIEDALGIDISELSQREIEQLRPYAYLHLAGQPCGEDDRKVHKIHDAFHNTAEGKSLIPLEATQSAIIIARNPLDIAVSLANHLSISLEESTTRLCDPEHVIERFNMQLRQKLGLWSDHVASWINADVKKIIIRYEDLKHDPLTFFRQISDFIELNKTDKEIQCAIDSCQFDKLQALENSSGFREKAPNVQNFFRKGIVGDWQTHLSVQQINTIIGANRCSMRRLGYLDSQDQPLEFPIDKVSDLNFTNS